MSDQDVDPRVIPLSAACDDYIEYLNSGRPLGTDAFQRIKGRVITLACILTGPRAGTIQDEQERRHPMTKPLEGAPESQWEPIASAPKDGMPVLVWDDGAITIASWVEDHDRLEGSGWYDHGIMDPPPSHWMPLPPAPKGGTE